MTVFVTLRVNDCDTGSALSGATVSDGYNLAYTNSYGEILLAWDNTIYEGYVFQVSKSGYDARSVTIYNSSNGTTVTTCLNRRTTTPSPPSSGGGSGFSCFIVTAATGSMLSDEVVRLRGLRDEVATRSPAAGALIDAIYNEYWQFSPPIADRMDADGLLRNGALLGAVRPLLAWYSLAAALALGDDPDAALAEMKTACPPIMPADRAADLIARTRKTGAVPQDAPEALQDVSDHVVAATRLPLVDWAILEPLQTCWQLAADGGDPVEAIAKWLEATPTGPLLSAGRKEAHSVTELLGFAPEARARLEARLQTA